MGKKHMPPSIATVISWSTEEGNTPTHLLLLYIRDRSANRFQMPTTNYCHELKVASNDLINAPQIGTTLYSSA